MTPIGSYRFNIFIAIFSAFATLSLVLLGLAFYVECAAMIEEILHANRNIIHENPNITIRLYQSESKENAYKCWFAALLYAFLFIYGIYQAYLHQMNIYYQRLQSDYNDDDLDEHFFNKLRKNYFFDKPFDKKRLNFINQNKPKKKKSNTELFEMIAIKNR